MILPIVFILLAMTIIFVALVCCLLIYRKRRRSCGLLTKEGTALLQQPEEGRREGNMYDSLKKKFGSLVIPYKSLTLGEVIGEGQ